MTSKIPQWAAIQGKQHPPVEVVYLPYDEEKWKRLFGVANPALKMTNIGEYSIAKPHIQEELVRVIKEYLPKAETMTVTETHGGVGGFTKVLAEHFKQVISCEILPQHCDVITNNMEVLGHKNVSVINKDYSTVFTEIKQDVIISDPPWGGPSFHGSKHIRLGVNDTDITFIINELFRQKRCRFFILFAPYNFDTRSFRMRLNADLVWMPDDVFSDRSRKHLFIVIRHREDVPSTEAAPFEAW